MNAYKKILFSRGVANISFYLAGLQLQLWSPSTTKNSNKKCWSDELKQKDDDVG